MTNGLGSHLYNSPYKGGADIGAPNLNAKTFAELIEEIEAEEEPTNG